MGVDGIDKIVDKLTRKQVEQTSDLQACSLLFAWFEKGRACRRG